MEHPMRRNRQALDSGQIERVLQTGTAGTLALVDQEGLPYAVPLSYVFHQGKLYFHSAKEGHKIQAIRSHPAASFCVIDQDRVVPEAYTTHYRSVIVFGTLRIVEDPALELEAIQALGRRYAPDQGEQALEAEIDQNRDRFFVIELEPRRITGKEAIELRRQREAQAE